ncbi:MAG: hypothetical protein J6J05_06230, partial [Peptococcaceae bacterium]|nr:hypothetical protein [Peptococcaceae bacterium]
SSCMRTIREDTFQQVGDKIIFNDFHKYPIPDSQKHLFDSNQSKSTKRNNTIVFPKDYLMKRFCDIENELNGNDNYLDEEFKEERKMKMKQRKHVKFVFPK